MDKFLSDEEMNEVLDDLTAAGILDKYTDGKKEHIPYTPERRERMEDALMLSMVAQTGYALMKGIKDGIIKLD